MKCLHLGLVAWIPNFFSPSVRILTLLVYYLLIPLTSINMKRWSPGSELCSEIAFHTQCSNVVLLGQPAVFSVTLQIAGPYLWERFWIPQKHLTGGWHQSPIWALCPEASQFRDSLQAVSWVLWKTQCFSTDPEKSQTPTRDDRDLYPHFLHD